jgi:FkbM family methyltransferase
MTKSSDFLSLHQLRIRNEITREKYWSTIQDFLNSLVDFSNLQEYFNNGIEIDNNQITVNIKISKTHDSKIKMLLDHRDIRSVPFSVLSDGVYEPFQADVLIELGTLSSRFLDIGANMGFYSLSLCVENKSLQAISFEPQPNVFNVFEKNIILNGLTDRIAVKNIALGHEKNNLTMFVPKFTGTGGASFRDLHSEEGISDLITVPIDVLDSQLIGGGEVDLIKIDCEGSELNVILGANILIKNYKPTIMVELLRKWMKPFGHTPQMFLDRMFNYGYKCLAINREYLLEVKEVNEKSLETNYIFIHPDRQNHYVLLKQFLK